MGSCYWKFFDTINMCVIWCFHRVQCCWGFWVTPNISWDRCWLSSSGSPQWRWVPRTQVAARVSLVIYHAGIYTVWTCPGGQIYLLLWASCPVPGRLPGTVTLPFFTTKYLDLAGLNPIRAQRLSLSSLGGSTCILAQTLWWLSGHPWKL